MIFTLDVETLPTLPTIVRQVLEHMNNPNSSIKDVAAIIGKDQSMSTKILKLVNSAFYGFPKRIGTISHAISILGFEAVKGLILGISILDTFQVKEFDLLSFWRHSLETASLSSHLASLLHYPRVDEAFTVGLIHDVGKLIFMLKVPEVYKEVLLVEKQTGRQLYEIEQELLQSDHAELGSQMAKVWNFPPSYIQAIAGHHEPQSFNDDTVSLELIVYLSNQLSNLAQNTELDVEQNLDLELIDDLGLDAGELLEYLESSRQEILNFLNILSS